jgi:hypothetical protein
MVSNKTNIYRQYKKLVALDSIRLLKLLEMLQQAVMLVILTIIISFIWNRMIQFFKLDINKTDDKINTMTFIEDISKLILHTFIIIVVTFYIRKLGLLIPSVSSMINTNFISNTTIHYALPVAIVAIFIGLVPSYKELLTRINKYQYMSA